MNSLWMNFPQDSACTFHRILQPGRYCSDTIKEFGWETHVGDGLPTGHDVYWLHGLPSMHAIVELVKLQRKGAKIVWGVDDDWLTIPDWNPAKPSEESMANYDIMKKMADWIVVSTPHLWDTFSDVADKVRWAPNLLNLGAFNTPPFESAQDGGRYYSLEVELPIRMVWSGGHTHKNDLLEMEEPLVKIMEKFTKDKVVLIYNGMPPPPSLLKKYLHNGLFHQPPVPFPQYSNVLNSIKCDIYLAPLAPIEFNLSKSNLRIIEGWALKTCPVASNWGEYGKTIKHEENGVLVNSPEEWYDSLARLIEDHQYRLQMAINGRNLVEKEYDWNVPQARSQWISVFRDILDIS